MSEVSRVPQILLDTRFSGGHYSREVPMWETTRLHGFVACYGALGRSEPHRPAVPPQLITTPCACEIFCIALGTQTPSRRDSKGPPGK